MFLSIFVILWKFIKIKKKLSQKVIKTAIYMATQTSNAIMFGHMTCKNLLQFKITVFYINTFKIIIYSWNVKPEF